MSYRFRVPALLYCIAACSPAAADGDEAEVPDVEFLEYLGMWGESDEDWQLFEDSVVAENEERSDPVPQGKESTENEDES